MKKREMTAVLTVIVMGLSLAACGQGQNQPSADGNAGVNEASGNEDTGADANEEAGASADGYDLSDCDPVKVVIPTAVSGSALESGYLEQWMDDVKKRSGGKITFDYTNGGALGSFEELLEGTDSGVYDMSLITLSYYETYVPEAAILSFPFLVQDYDDARDVLNGQVGDWLKEKVLENTNTGWMGYLMCYFRWMNTSTKISTLEDCQNVLIRVPTTQITIDTFDKMGFSTVPLPFSDIYTAMSTGVVNGVETSGESIYNYGFCDYAKYVCKSNHQPIIESVIYNQDFWNGLPEVYRQIMTDAMKDMLAEEWTASESKEESFSDLLASEKEVTVTEFSEEAMKEIQEVFTDYWYDKAKAISEETSDMLTWEIDVVNNN